MTIGTRIASLRKAKGFTQEYVAEQLGVTRQAVSKWEQDQTSPDTNNLIALSQLLGASVEYLATGNIEGVAGSAQNRKSMIVTINSKISIGNFLLIIGFILLFLIPLLGIVLMVIGCVYLINAWNMENYVRSGAFGSERKAKPEVSKEPWVCCSCGHENESWRGYCFKCNTNRDWSKLQQEK